MATETNRPTAGDRVRVTRRGSASQYGDMTGTVLDDDRSPILPFLVRLEDDDRRERWFGVAELEVIEPTPQPEIERSPTATELRIKALEDTNKALQVKVAAQEVGFGMRLDTLERQMASLRSLLHQASNV